MSSPSPFLSDALAFAAELAEASGDVIRRYFRQPVPVDIKADDSPVTLADREAETAMRQLITARYPDHGIYGEEHGQDGIDREWVWVLDPIDGTRSFLAGKPVFGTLIALAHHGRPVLGVLDQPISKERWVAAEGLGCTLNGAPQQARRGAALEEATLSTTSPHLFASEADFAAFERVRRQVRTPMYGADCYAYALLASGFIDLVIESDLKPYDYMALAPLIQEAGGTITDWQGTALTLQSDGRTCAAGDAALHQAALTALNTA